MLGISFVFIKEAQERPLNHHEQSVAIWSSVLEINARLTRKRGSQ
jgi:hypothetical protein